MKTETTNLLEGIHQECDRVREVLKEYENIGPAGLFGVTMIKQSIRKAEKSIEDNDVVAMLVAFRDLKQIQ